MVIGEEKSFVYPLSPGGTDTSDATATASDILDGKTAYVNGSKVTGNIPSKTSSDVSVSDNVVSVPAGAYASGFNVTVGFEKAAQTITPTTSDQTIAAGKYLTGAQTIKGDANLIAANIAQGVTIFGVTGTHSGGAQPTLFAPVVTGGYNEVSWANNSSNGDFVVTLTADVNGTPVTSPLTITEQMDGKTLTIVASANNFESVSTTIVLAYISAHTNVYAASSNDNIYIQATNLSLGKVGSGATTMALFNWVNQQNSTYTSSDEIYVAGLYSDSISFTVGVPSTGNSGFLQGAGYGALKPITGTIVFENITSGNSKTITFNNQSQVSVSGFNSFVSVNDALSIKINITAM